MCFTFVFCRSTLWSAIVLCALQLCFALCDLHIQSQEHYQGQDWVWVKTPEELFAFQFIPNIFRVVEVRSLCKLLKLFHSTPCLCAQGWFQFCGNGLRNTCRVWWCTTNINSILSFVQVNSPIRFTSQVQDWDDHCKVYIL